MKIVTGDDFTFGKGRGGDFALLESQGLGEAMNRPMKALSKGMAQKLALAAFAAVALAACDDDSNPAAPQAVPPNYANYIEGPASCRPDAPTNPPPPPLYAWALPAAVSATRCRDDAPDGRLAGVGWDHGRWGAGTCVGIGFKGAGVTQNIYDWVIIDEAAIMPAHIWNQVVRPTLLDHEGGALMINDPALIDRAEITDAITRYTLAVDEGDGALKDLVFEGRDAQRAHLGPSTLRDVHATHWLRVIATAMHSVLKVREPFVEILGVLRPRLFIHTRGCSLVETCERLAK